MIHVLGCCARVVRMYFTSRDVSLRTNPLSPTPAARTASRVCVADVVHEKLTARMSVTALLVIDGELRVTNSVMHNIDDELRVTNSANAQQESLPVAKMCVPYPQ